jgi:hypothetical protein
MTYGFSIRLVGLDAIEVHTGDRLYDAGCGDGLVSSSGVDDRTGVAMLRPLNFPDYHRAYPGIPWDNLQWLEPKVGDRHCVRAFHEPVVIHRLYFKKFSFPRTRLCPDCKGTKRIVLLHSIQSCGRCNADGRITV